LSSMPSEAEVFAACRVLFGRQILLSRDFLGYLQPQGAKTAYRKRAKETHPDLYRGQDPKILQQHVQTFREATQAYRLLSLFLREREKQPARTFGFSPHPHRREDAAGRAEPRPSPPSPPPVSCPPRQLQIGLYLYYRKVISFRVLAEALVWQRRQRDPFGKVARRWGWLTDAGLARICVARLPFSRFGERAVHLGLLTPFQVRTLLLYQGARQKRLGEYFVERRLVSFQEMEGLVADLRHHNARIRADLREEGRGPGFSGRQGPSRKDRP
jgi:hypothetical protein